MTCFVFCILIALLIYAKLQDGGILEEQFQ